MKDLIKKFIEKQIRTGNFTYIGFPDSIFIYHITNLKNIKSIIESYKLFNQIQREKYEIVLGEGSINRKFCNAYNYTLENKNDSCEEAYGVFFRIANSIEKIKLSEGTCALIFSVDILDDYDWHVNLCENNGFYIKPNEKIPFGDCDEEIQISFNKDMINVNKELIQNSIKLQQLELIIYENVSLKYCFCIKYYP